MVKSKIFLSIFFSLLWHQPDKHLPEKYRAGRINFQTAFSVAWDFAKKQGDR